MFSNEFKKTHGFDIRISDKDIFAFYKELAIKKFRGIYTRIGLNCGKKLYLGRCVKLSYKTHLLFGNNINIGDYVEIQGLSYEGISFGDNINIGKGTIIRGSGSMTKIGKGFSCGENFCCGDFCFFGCSGGIKIGSDCILGQSIRMHSQNHCFDDDSIIRKQDTSEKEITIGNNCWIGSGVVILAGCHIGNGVVIGANTLVNKNVVDNSVVVGNPMRVIRNRLT